ncbi:MmcB family DNA repair protein [Helicobacter sp. MIT 14-3879]|uniref:MmcB family DNA repair protein n=1 Tax=Helicobacter sp. MIT 14-3879 TaxID=2040649 RepID=UPI000E1F7B2E|nr:MmcB family DNA repair protein [Helicobacter sp. MIT 14-3879]RDU63553.1 hypothetical protein CQA44_05590 [Helicobacter sp. MIT 14-3879]
MEEKMRFLLLKQILQKSPLDLAAIEVSLMQGKRKADLLIAKKNELIAYEIKSCKDNLAKLNGQISDYLKIFDKVYVVLDIKFKKDIISIPEQVGIILFDSKSSKFKILRKPQKNNPIMYYQTLFVNSKKLKLYKQNGIIDIFDLRHFLVKHLKKKDLKQLVFECLKEKYSYGFELFQKIFHNNEIHLSDIYLLYCSSQIKTSA